MILPEHKIYLHKSLIFPRNIEDFVSFLFLESFPETYYDIESKQTQCLGGKNRSFTDLVCLCNTYFPSYSMKELKQIVLKSCMENIIYMPWFGFILCRDIGKVVIFMDDNIRYSKVSFCHFNAYLQNKLNYNIDDYPTIDEIKFLNLKQILNNYE